MAVTILYKIAWIKLLILVTLVTATAVQVQTCYQTNTYLNPTQISVKTSFTLRIQDRGHILVVVGGNAYLEDDYILYIKDNFHSSTNLFVSFIFIFTDVIVKYNYLIGNSP